MDDESSKSKFDNFIEGVGFLFWIVGGVGIVVMQIYTICKMLNQ